MLVETIRIFVRKIPVPYSNFPIARNIDYSKCKIYPITTCTIPKTIILNHSNPLITGIDLLISRPTFSVYFIVFLSIPLRKDQFFSNVLVSSNRSLFIIHWICSFENIFGPPRSFFFFRFFLSFSLLRLIFFFCPSFKPCSKAVSIMIEIVKAYLSIEISLRIGTRIRDVVDLPHNSYCKHTNQRVFHPKEHCHSPHLAFVND